MVYPRVCGGNKHLHILIAGPVGLSPRVRGKRVVAFRHLADIRSIPACAGETVAIALYPHIVTVYPRVCGGNWPKPEPGPRMRGLSPRVRGKRPLSF